MEEKKRTEQLIRHSLDEAMLMLQAFIADKDSVEVIVRAAEICADCIGSGGKIICCGNGGSLCDATHLAEELTGRFRNNRPSLPAICINDPAHITCAGNDFSFQEIFSRYIEGMGQQGDVLVAISTSGKSENIIRAVRAAQERSMKIVALTMKTPNPLAEMADVAVCAPPAPHSDRVQEIHIKVIHILIEAIEALLVERGLV